MLGLFNEDWLGKTVAFAGTNTEADDEDQPEELPAGTRVASVTRDSLSNKASDLSRSSPCTTHSLVRYGHSHPAIRSLSSCWAKVQCRPLQTGLPFSSRSTSVSFPFTTSRARMRSASPALTFDPVREISSPLLKLKPRSWRNDCGQR